MIEPASRTQTIHLPPGQLYTGLRQYACDGAVLEALVEGTTEQPRISSCRIVELHDINVGQRKTRHDVGAYLRRCLQRVNEEGLIVVRPPQVISIPAQRISVGDIRFQQFCSPGRTDGPFSSPDEIL